METVYTPQEAAEILKVKVETVKIHLRKGTLKGFKVGNRWRIKESDLREFMRTNNIGE
jgi:excisionase family DNA binding protein